MLKMKKEILENEGSNDGTIVKSNNDSNESLSSNDGGTIGTKKSNNNVYFYGIGGGLSILAMFFFGIL